ncbi:MAG: purine-nucleoside phosphorylase [Polyangiaceae bacterium]
MPSLSQPPVSSVAARLDDSVFSIRKRGLPAPRVGVVLGSGMGSFADGLEDLVKIPYRDLPHMPISDVPGHAGNLCFGAVRGIPVVCMQGRVHLYEGHPVAKVVHGVRIMARLGATVVLLTNAAGALQASWTPGDVMAITDHINLMGTSPLIGPNDDALGPRFPDMSDAYDAHVRRALSDASLEAGVALREGVYAAVLGPSYETPAEVRLLAAAGAHAVGMSTVPEVIALRHMGVRVGALSCIANLAAGMSARKLRHDEVEATASARAREMALLLRGWIARVGIAE